MTEIEIREINDLERSAREFLEHIGDASVIAFYGAMGAGKTTFITALCKVLGVKDVVNSPTFTIVNEYLSGTGRSIYHFDFYRINKLSEAIDIGFDEYIYSDGLCLIEWPEKIEELLPEETLRVHITVEGDDLRILNF
ncbi:MAG: tRNA (adenosine(37)-N6)-threonylcarbamoyltransferase complex ATPase subunit type 1 TsaE [Bacteroidales bacterium]|jgi:tRNA threonylcarbamoyladenosine biosynthesis protein TsaE